MKKILLLLLVPTLSFSQDIIIKKNNDTLHCTIKRIDPKKIWYVPVKSNVTSFFPLKQASSYIYQGVRTEVTQESINYKDWMANTPGQELRLSSNHFYKGVLIMLAGSIATYAGAYNRSMPITIAGGVVSLAGGALIIESHIHITRAGILFDKK